MKIKQLSCDLCIIGGGSGGLSLAAGAAQLGQKVVLIEKDKMGGDCLNVGCIPSKSLIAAAAVANAQAEGKQFGITPKQPDIAIAKVQAHVADIIAQIAPHDSVERFTKLGVQVIPGHGQFASPSQIIVQNKQNKTSHCIDFRRAVIATGSRAAIPPIPGLDKAKPLTNETIFRQTKLPQQMIVIGGGPIGCELAQAWQRLGSNVTLLEVLPRILFKDDPEAAELITQQFSKEGIKVHTGVNIKAVSKQDKTITVQYQYNNKKINLRGDAILVAAGRKPNIDNLRLEQANITFSTKGIATDANLRTSNRTVYAIGDVNVNSLAFTHVAGYQASLLIRKLLFKVSGKYDNHAIPWCSYTDPEVAQVGLTELEARKVLGSRLRVQKLDWHLTDRGRAERCSPGFIKVIADNKGFVHGATLVGKHAGEHLLIWVLMIKQQIKLSVLASLVAPYPTLSEGHKQVAGAFYREKLFSDQTRRLIRLLKVVP